MDLCYYAKKCLQICCDLTQIRAVRGQSCARREDPTPTTSPEQGMMLRAAVSYGIPGAGEK